MSSKETGKDTQRHREKDNVKMKADIEVMLTQPRKDRSHQKLEEAGKDPPLELLEQT